MPQKRLMTPGPTQVPEPARLAMARQVIHHRTSDFRAMLAEVLDEMGHAVSLGSAAAEAGRVIQSAGAKGSTAAAPVAFAT